MKKLLLSGILGTVVSCAHPHIGNSSPTIGQSKSEVVETYGSPTRSWRSQGQDHWFFEARGQKKILVFENNRLVAIKTPGSEDDGNELEMELQKLKTETPQGAFQDLSD